MIKQRNRGTEHRALNASNSQNLRTSEPQTLRNLVIDPFCGSGNILIEALLLGCDAMGSDVSEKAVNASLNNIKWLVENPTYRDKITSKNPKPKVHIERADAATTDFAKLLSSFSFQLDSYDRIAVVAEPFLGEPKKFKPSLNAVKGEYSKIQELYLDFLKNLLKPKAPLRGLPACSLVLVFPLIETLEGKLYSLFDASVDEIEKIGYSVLTKPLVYGREYQVVKREIVLLEIKN